MPTTRISDHDYMILRPDDSDSRDFYIIARYALDRVALRVCLPDPDRVRQAIKYRKLKGSYGSLGGAEITETSEGVLRFLKSKETDAMFTCAQEFSFTKVPD